MELARELLTKPCDRPIAALSREIGHARGGKFLDEYYVCVGPPLTANAHHASRAKNRAATDFLWVSYARFTCAIPALMMTSSLHTCLVFVYPAFMQKLWFNVSCIFSFEDSWTSRYAGSSFVTGSRRCLQIARSLSCQADGMDADVEDEQADDEQIHKSRKSGIAFRVPLWYGYLFNYR